MVLYWGTFVLVGLLLYSMGLPVFAILFLGAISHFVRTALMWKGREPGHDIFAFYLTAADILRNSNKHWYGFEINEAIKRGQELTTSIVPAPPLLYVALGALLERSGDTSASLKCYSMVYGENAVNEAAIAFPSDSLRGYVATLRRIEASPAESPRTLSAIRSLERLRNGAAREAFERMTSQNTASLPRTDSGAEAANVVYFEGSAAGERKSITEVLSDIYDDRTA